MIQTSIAILVCVAYYIQNRAKLSLLVNRAEARPEMNILKIFTLKTWH